MITTMRPGDPYDHALFIDTQASFDLGAGCLAELEISRINMAVRRAIVFAQGTLTTAAPKDDAQ